MAPERDLRLAPIAACAVAAWFGMNDVASAKASFRDQAAIFRRKHNWLVCWLYLGTFGSFIGFGGWLADRRSWQTRFPWGSPRPSTAVVHGAPGERVTGSVERSVPSGTQG